MDPHARDVPERFFVEASNTGIIRVTMLPPVVRVFGGRLDDGEQVVHLGKKIHVRRMLLQLGVHHFQNRAVPKEPRLYP